MLAIKYAMIGLIIDARLMFYRKAGISQYTRHLVTALADLADVSLNIAILLDRRDQDLAWLPKSQPAVKLSILRAFTPAHHRLERFILPFELALLQTRHPFQVLHSPDFITARGRFKKIITIHDLYFMQHPEVMSSNGARYYGQVGWSLRQADAVIAVSDFTRRDIHRLHPQVPTSKVHVVHEAAQPANNVSHITPNAAPYALFVGTTEPRKNLITLLAALARLRDQAALPADFKLCIAGAQGWAGDTPQHMAHAQNLAGMVDVLGEVSHERLQQLYHGARLLLLPSHYEGFGLTALEAMAHGTPVICSNAGSLPEIVGDAALCHDPLDATTLAAHIVRVWHDETLRRDLANRGQHRASQFSWGRAARETAQIYQATI